MKKSFKHTQKAIFLFFLSWILISSVQAGLNKGYGGKISDKKLNQTEFYGSEVWVDDDYYDGGYNDGHTWGTDAFDNIQDGIDNVTDAGIVNIREGTYSTFIVENRNDIEIIGIDITKPIIQGNQLAWDSTLTTPGFVKCVIFINNSVQINFYKIEIQGINLSGRSYSIYFNGSQGSIYESIISPNERGNMNSIAVRGQLFSDINIENCTIENYGRIGIYVRTGSELRAYYNTIIGPYYLAGEGDWVSYGIEVEDLEYASDAVIRYNEIYNHHHTGNPTWSSAAIIIDAWRYYELTEENCTAIIEFNNIHNNMIGLQIVPNDEISVNRNKIYDNYDYGAVSDPYWDGQELIDYPLDAISNWWGHETGPYNEESNPEGIGDNVTDFVIIEPWIETINPKVTITQPEDWFCYINIKDIWVFKIPCITNLIVGKIEIRAEAPDCLYGVQRVEFYIDDQLKSVDYTEPYSWSWEDKQLLFLYTIKVKVFDNKGNNIYDDIRVWKLF